MHPALLLLLGGHLVTGLIAFLSYFWLHGWLYPGHDVKRLHAVALILAWPVAGPVLFLPLALRGLRLIRL